MGLCSYNATSDWGRGRRAGELVVRVFRASEGWKGGRRPWSIAVFITCHCDQTPDKSN